MPIKVKCPNADCGKVATVKDEFAGKRAKCPACGTIMTIPNGTGVAAAPAAHHPAAPPPAAVQAPPPAARQRPAAPPPAAAEGYAEGAEAWGGPPAPKSGLVTAVAILNFVIGGLILVCGLWWGLIGGAVGAGGEAIQRGSQVKIGGNIGDVKFDQEFAKEFNKAAQTASDVGGTIKLAGTLVMIVSLIGVLWGGGAIAAGVGLIKRRLWGLTSGKIIAMVAGGLGILWFIPIFMLPGGFLMIEMPLFYLAYAGFALFVLMFRPNAKAEFA
jgi:ribosomal protein S27E